MLLLNIGCGDHYVEGWTNLDCFPGIKADVHADIREIPFADNSAAAVYCGHVLEHLPFADLPQALGEVARVLKPQGRACFVGPDFKRAIELDVEPLLLDLIRDGGDRWPGDQHQWLSTGTSSLAAIRDVFPAAHEVPVERLDDFWPLVAPALWQFAIVI